MYVHCTTLHYATLHYMIYCFTTVHVEALLRYFPSDAAAADAALASRVFEGVP